MEYDRVINYKTAVLRILLFFAGCFGYLYPMCAQVLADSIPNEKIRVFTYNIGFTGTFNRSTNGESAWQTGDSKDAVGFVNALQYMYFPSKKNIGYGIHLYNYTRNKKHSIDNDYLKERINISYIAPQIMYLKRKVAFKHCYTTFGGGIGYVYYDSKEKLPSGKNCKAKSSSFGIHANMGYEYQFAKYWGARIEVGCLYSPINLHYNDVPEGFSFKPRNKFDLCMMNIQIGISSYL